MKVTTDWWGVAIHAEDAAELNQLRNLQQSTGAKAADYYEEGEIELVLPGTAGWDRLAVGVCSMQYDGSVGCLLIAR